ncbi:MAG: methylated-DNA--protein-cysteine methyltransferase [Deltaproteobacteria bacterium]|nr:methylated-DNA--protein-cysteine methyltransferase [Deltaproteobacteria bacterium]
MLKMITIESPLGPLRLLERDGELAGVYLPSEPTPADGGRASDAADSGRASGQTTPLLDRVATQLAEYFAGDRRAFDLPVAPRGSEFQELVWRALVAIPFGETRSYGQLARSIGQPTASRAVGAANGRNPIAIIVPCHRVIGATGALTGYAGGMAAKRWLLDHERRFVPCSQTSFVV